MAEQEIIEHTKKAYKVWFSKEHTFWHKLQEFLLEIFIIVFAVSISIWLHNWSEHRSEQAQVKDFLSDLKEDLVKDTQIIAEQNGGLKTSIQNFQVLQAVNVAYIDSMNKANSTIQVTTNQLIRENYTANYEGFKSSGKIGLIENKELKKLILAYEQELLPKLSAEEGVYNQQMNKITDYATSNWGKSDRDLLINPKFTVLLRLAVQWGDRINNSDKEAIESAKQIISDINKEENNK